MRLNNLLAAGIFAICFSPFAGAQTHDWVVSKQWSPDMEKKFSEFIAVMGESGCGSLNKCLKSSSANPMYVNRTPKDVSYYADCADLPYALRGYFSWMEGLPFDYVNSLSQDPRNNGDDERYGKYGNIPEGFRTLKPGQTYDGPKELSNLTDAISTAMYRMHYKYVSDFYPAGINAVDIKPGTVMYDPAGHAAIIYRVDKKDGSIKMMDAHPDGSLTHIRFDQKFVRSRKEHGAGFKNWRPELDKTPTTELPRFSTERFESSYAFNGTEMDYYEFVRTVMSGGNMKINPVEELKSMVNELCLNTHDREAAVNEGLKSGIAEKSHPANLPRNIYGTGGEWESYSTPSRDARLKTGFVAMLAEVQRLVQLAIDKPGRISYVPVASRYSDRCQSDDANCYMNASLLEAYEDATNAPECHFEYKRSDGKVVELGYEDVVSRLFKISFDPYHCAELRWGATGKELESCPDGKTKLSWYQAERGLRNQIERRYEDVMDKDLAGAAALGVAEAPNVDLAGYLESLLR